MTEEEDDLSYSQEETTDEDIKAVEEGNDELVKTTDGRNLNSVNYGNTFNISFQVGLLWLTSLLSLSSLSSSWFSWSSAVASSVGDFAAGNNAKGMRRRLAEIMMTLLTELRRKISTMRLLEYLGVSSFSC